LCIAEAIPDSEFDDSTRRKIKAGEKLGALWHIYKAEDADKIREFLTQVGNVASCLLEKNLTIFSPFFEFFYVIDFLWRKIYLES
jgi:hypothetical protein